MRTLHWLVFTLLFSCIPSLTFAGYGMYAIGYGGESHGMAGADIARSSSGLGSNVNPAGMARVYRGNMSMYVEIYDLSGWRHEDSIGNDTGVDPTTMGVFGAGYAFRPERFNNLVFGVAFLAQGGTGYTYPQVMTLSGEEDELSSLFGVFRLAPAVAWQVNERLSLGLSVGLNYSEAVQKIFPETSIAASGDSPAFYGSRLDDLSGISGSFRLGLQYRLTDNLDWGVAYGSPTKLRLENGKATVNYEAIGLGRVSYQDASLKGLALAQELGTGFSWKATPRWEIAAEVEWINWSDSVEESTLSLSKPSNSLAPDKIVSTSALDFKDQYALSLAARYRLNENTWVMGGVTHVRNPVPKKALNPIISLVSEYHITLGVTHQFSPKWRGVATFFYSPKNTVSYTNTTLPLGSSAEETGEIYDITFSIERSW